MAIDDPNNYSLGSFFLALASIFVVGKVISSIFVKFRQPEVLGELTAGVILGSLALIPLLNEPGYHVFHLLAEVGVAILLFEIGLETDLDDESFRSDLERDSAHSSLVNQVIKNV